MRALTAVIAAAVVLLTATPVSAEPVNQPPVALDDTVDVRSSAGISWDVRALANDTDPDGDTLTFTAVTEATKGVTSLASGRLWYKTILGTSGPDSFTYTVSDGHGNTATATVSVTIWVDPALPSGVAISSSAPGSATLTWSAATRAAEYRIYRNRQLVGSTSNLTWTDAGLLDSQSYDYQISSVNGGGYESYWGNAATVYRRAQLATPTGLTVDVTDDPTALDVRWNYTGWAGPRIVYRDGVQVATSDGYHFKDSGLVTGREYSYQVQHVFPPSSTQIFPASLLSAPVTATPAVLTEIGTLVYWWGGRNSDLGPVTIPERAVPGGSQQDHRDGVIVQQDGKRPITVMDDFATAFAATGGVLGELGFPLEYQGICGIPLDDSCRQQSFEGGGIWSSAYTPTRVVRPVIEDGWDEAGGIWSPMGLPVGNQVSLPGGVAQSFEDGGVYWSAATGSHAVVAETHDTYAAWGGPAGRLGWPTTGDVCGLRGDGCFQQFRGGSIYWSPVTGAHTVGGAIAVTWGHTGWENGLLGYPLTSEIPIARGGRFQRFQGGSIYWSPTTGAHVVTGAIRDTWGRAGWEIGLLGYPLTGEIPIARGGRFQRFQGGSIYWSPTTGAHVVTGAIAGTWGSTGWENGYLGYPLTGEIPLARGGRFQQFQGGAVYWTLGTGAHAVSGAIRDTWAGQGWENGRLGYPISAARVVSGAHRQDFQGGTITISLAPLGPRRITYR